MKGLVQQIKDIKANDKQTVVFALKGANADFPFILSDYRLPIVPAGTAGAKWEKGIGTGGYILVSHEPGEDGFPSIHESSPSAKMKNYDSFESLYRKKTFYGQISLYLSSYRIYST